MIDLNPNEWGVEKYGAKLHINKEMEYFDPKQPLVVDIETDEHDNFVGIGMTQNGKDIYYYKTLPQISTCLVTHGGAFDIRQLQNNHCPVTYDNIIHDTKILTYCHDSTLKHYSLKSLSKRFLNMKYPTYEELVGKGKKKQTLDQQPIEIVANYCGCDVLATYRLMELMLKKLTPKLLELYKDLELPLYRLLARMEDEGVYIDVEYLHKLHDEFKEKMDKAREKLRQYGEFNPRSPKQLLELFKKEGIKVSTTNVKALESYTHIPLIHDLLQYRKYKKLLSTYIDPYINSPTLPVLHPRFHQSTETGRLASS